MAGGDGVVVSTLGEALLRLSARIGERIEDAPDYEVHVAGSEANVVYALARTGIRAQWASLLPRNALGDRVERTLAAGGVCLEPVVRVEGARLGTYFVELGTRPRPTRVVYDRAGSAFALASEDAFEWDIVCRGRLFHIAGISFAVSPGAARVAMRALQEARRRGLTTTYDVNYRQHLATPREAADTVAAVAPLLDVLLCRLEDARELFRTEADAEETALDLRDRFGVETVVVTDGPVGAVGADASGVVARPAYLVESIVDPVGAGDAFAAGVIAGLLEGSLSEGLERGLAMAALKMTLRGDLFRFGLDEINVLRGGDTRPIVR